MSSSFPFAPVLVDSIDPLRLPASTPSRKKVKRSGGSTVLSGPIVSELSAPSPTAVALRHTVSSSLCTESVPPPSTFSHPSVASASSNAAKVEQKYKTQLGFASPQDREKSENAPLLKYNNFIHAGMIRHFGPVSRASPAGTPEFSVLDLAAGTGQLMLKLARDTKYKHWTVIDLVKERVRKAQERFMEYEAKSNMKMTADFHVYDCFQHSLETLFVQQWRHRVKASSVLSPSHVSLPMYDLVVCTLAIHYSFESLPILRQALLNMAQFLRRGQRVLLTFVNFDFVEKQLFPRQELSLDQCMMVGHPAMWKITLDLPFTQWKMKHPNGGTGQKYCFYLKGHIDDTPEYVVDEGLLLEEAAKVGLDSFYHATFPDLWRLFSEKYLDDKKKMHGEELNESHQQVANLYKCLVLQKR